LVANAVLAFHDLVRVQLMQIARNKSRVDQVGKWGQADASSDM
jgi:hypothetical protein